MTTIVTRAGKGSPLTFAEADANFVNLNTCKVELLPGDVADRLNVPINGNLSAAVLAWWGIPGSGTVFRLSVAATNPVGLAEAIHFEPNTYIARSDPGGNVHVNIENLGPGDAWLEFGANLGGAYRIGIDYSDSYAFIIQQGLGALGTNVMLRAVYGNTQDLQNFALNGGLSAANKTDWGFTAPGSGTAFRFVVGQSLDNTVVYEASLFETDLYVERAARNANDPVGFAVITHDRGGFNAADAYVLVKVEQSGTTHHYAQGIDVSDSFAYVLSSSGTLGTNNIVRAIHSDDNEQNFALNGGMSANTKADWSFGAGLVARFTVGQSGAASYEFNLFEPDTYVSRRDAGTVTLQAVNTDTTAGDALIGPASYFGDARVSWQFRGAPQTSYDLGIDVSDSRAFVLSYAAAGLGAALGTNNLMRATATDIAFPSASVLRVYNGSTDRLGIVPQAAGGGVILESLNAAENAYQKITIPYTLQMGFAALSTTSTDGFPYIPSCAGTPTGVPTAITNFVPIVWDRTNHKLYVYDGAWIAMN